jgi:superfamily II DNA or RNA helicase
MGAGADAFRYEKDFIQNSDKRLEFIKKLVDKCDTNTLLLFHTIEYGTKIFNKLKEELPDKDFYYIDGEVNNKQREIIKKEMEKTDGKVKVLIASYGTLSTGVSINAIFNVIFADSFKSEQIIIQSIGRALRKHDQKKIATIFDIVDVFDPKELNNILYKHFLEREKFYKKRKYPYKVIKMNL